MTATMAIKNYLERSPNGRKVETAELLAFKRACTTEEWKAMGKDAAEALGVELTES